MSDRVYIHVRCIFVVELTQWDIRRYEIIDFAAKDRISRERASEKISKDASQMDEKEKLRRFLSYTCLEQSIVRKE